MPTTRGKLLVDLATKKKSVNQEGEWTTPSLSSAVSRKHLLSALPNTTDGELKGQFIWIKSNL